MILLSQTDGCVGGRGYHVSQFVVNVVAERKALKRKLDELEAENAEKKQKLATVEAEKLRAEEKARQAEKESARDAEKVRALEAERDELKKKQEAVPPSALVLVFVAHAVFRAVV